MADGFLYFQSIVQFRIPIGGGSPQVLKKFTTEMKGDHSAARAAPKQQPIPFETEVGEEVLL